MILMITDHLFPMPEKLIFFPLLHTQAKQAASTHLWAFFLLHILKESCRTSWITVKNYQDVEFLSCSVLCYFRRLVKSRQKAVEFPIDEKKKTQKCMPNLRSSEWFKLINKHYSILFLSPSICVELLEKWEKILQLNIPKTCLLTIAKRRRRENKIKSFF